MMFFFSFFGQIFGDEEECGLGSSHSKNQRQEENDKADGAVISTLQVEALWKISKIELDRTIQEACNVILTGNYFFFPTHYKRKIYTRQSQHASICHSSGNDYGDDGWVVSSTGQAIDTDVGRLRAAAALVLVGDILVQCSKEGTSWRE